MIKYLHDMGYNSRIPARKPALTENQMQWAQNALQLFRQEPLAGDISSMEYGWGECLLVPGSIPIINDWQAPTPMMSSSILDEATQLQVLIRYVQDLSIELDQHRDIKPRVEQRFASYEN
ncbi:hypothetical protein EDC94DRAFT_659579 [Helicostylum pulchrum]|nr:hypothetical protein EDC94DRAFT_659579 [Helicostylum pulchrum]